MNQMRKIAIGFGSNVGESLQTIKKAATVIVDDFLMKPQGSLIYKTTPWRVPDEQSDYYNAVIVGQTEWKPPAVVNYLKSLEKDLGRQDRERYHKREIDLDLILSEQEIYEEKRLYVPQREMEKRAFVLIPLATLWSDWSHPTLNLTVEDMMSQLPPEERDSVEPCEPLLETGGIL